jgi:endonuclease YncB( thermonuclease family)
MKQLGNLGAAIALLTTAVPAKDRAAGKWVPHEDAEFTGERQGDGDSFGMRVKTSKGNGTTRTYRLYGVDCPETDASDKRVASRIKEQAECFGCDPDDIPKLGKQAAAFTEKLLKHGKPVIHTRGPYGEKAEKNPGRPQRYFALVEVTAADGKRRMLHELLLEAGLARAHGVPAAWPPAEEDRHGEKEACADFMSALERLEKAARRAKAGAWKNARP